MKVIKEYIYRVENVNIVDKIKSIDADAIVDRKNHEDRNRFVGVRNSNDFNTRSVERENKRLINMYIKLIIFHFEIEFN